MPDKKLTDKEIVKGLECHGKPSNSCGSSCPYLMCEEILCTKVLVKDALDLINRLTEQSATNKVKAINYKKEINRLQAENENYSKNNQQMTSDILNLYKALEEAKAENERLKPFEDKIAEFNSHIRVEDMLVFASSLEEWLEFCENLKAEAYKEFAEMLHEELRVYGIKDKFNKSVFLNVVDKAKKELAGDKSV